MITFREFLESSWRGYMRGPGGHATNTNVPTEIYSFKHGKYRYRISRYPLDGTMTITNDADRNSPDRVMFHITKDGNYKGSIYGTAETAKDVIRLLNKNVPTDVLYPPVIIKADDIAKQAVITKKDLLSIDFNNFMYSGSKQIIFNNFNDLSRNLRHSDKSSAYYTSNVDGVYYELSISLDFNEFRLSYITKDSKGLNDMRLRHVATPFKPRHMKDVLLFFVAVGYLLHDGDTSRLNRLVRFTTKVH